MAYKQKIRKFFNRYFGFCGLLAAAILLLNSSFASAADYYWNVASGDWSTAANWQTGVEPTSSDNAWINNSGTAIITQSNEACQNLYLGDTNPGTVEMSSGSLTVSGTSHVGYSNIGSFTQNGGINSISNNLYLGYNSGSIGIYNLNNTGQLNAIREYIGYSGTGNFTQSGGINSLNSTLYLGYKIGSFGTYILSGTAQLSSKVEYIGYNNSANAIFEQSGGGNTSLYYSIGTNGQYIFSGGTLQIDDGFDNQGTMDFDNAPGVMTINSAIVNLARPGSVLKNTQSSSVTLDSTSLLILPANFDVSHGFASLNINGGIVHKAGTQLVVPVGQTIIGSANIDDPVLCYGTISGSNPFFNNTLMIYGSVSKLLYLRTDDLYSGINGGSLTSYGHYVGYTGTGVFTQSGGSNWIDMSGSLYLGYNSSTQGTYYLSGTGQLSVNTGNEYIGYSGSGTFTQSGGANSIYHLGNLYFGYNSQSIGTYNLYDGNLKSLAEYIGYNGTGIFTQSGGTNHTTRVLLGVKSGSSGIYNLNGGTLISSVIGSGTGVFNFGGGTFQADSNNLYISMPITLTGTGGNANINTVGYSVTLSGILSGTGGLNKFGSGKLTLSATNTYSGSTTVTQGTLALLGSGSIGSSSFIDVQSGAIFDVLYNNGFRLGNMQTLKGDGTIYGNVVADAGSHIDPGDSIGILYLTHNLILNSGAILDFDLGATLASDKLSMDGSILYLNNQQFSDFTFSTLNGFGKGNYILIDAGGISGNLGSNVTGTIGSLSATLSKSGNDLILTVVPEPGTWVLLASALACLAFYARKRRR